MEKSLIRGKTAAVSLKLVKGCTQPWSPSRGTYLATGVGRTLTVVESVHFTAQTTKFMVKPYLYRAAKRRPSCGRNGVYKKARGAGSRFPG